MENETRGRKTSMDETLKKVAINLAENHGLTDKEIAASLGICETTIHNTKKYDESFFKALKDAKENFCNKLIEESLIKKCIGLTVKEVQTKIIDGKQIKTIIEKELPPCTTAITLYLRNRLGEKYNQDKQKISIEVESQRGLTREEAKLVLASDPFLSCTD